VALGVSAAAKLALSPLTRRLFTDMLRKIAALPVPTRRVGDDWLLETRLVKSKRSKTVRRKGRTG
jgi:hypothetical protein